MRQSCGCCAGVERLTPAATANPPGLDSLHYRVGTHGSFLETMLARLSSLRIGSESPLAGLRVRTGDDPSIALLDAWATVAEVLTFYQERIANEGYLRTATERSSILELARLVGYRLRPGLAASTYVAYLLDVVAGQETTATIPAGSRIQSVPGPGELPQSFETAEGLYARGSWNTLRPRLTQPTVLARNIHTLYAAGISTQLSPNDRVLLAIPGEPTPDVRRVASVTADPAENRTAVTLQPVQAEGGPCSPSAPTWDLSCCQSSTQPSGTPSTKRGPGPGCQRSRHQTGCRHSASARFPSAPPHRSSRSSTPPAPPSAPRSGHSTPQA